MKLTKKLASLVLAMIMVFAMSSSVFAADPQGSITINGIGVDSEGELNTTYEIYKLLDLESYDKTSGAYSYKVNTAWAGFFATADALKYVSIDQTNYVSWKAGEDDETVAAFAKLALAYAKANGIDPVKSSAEDGDMVLGTNEKNEVTGKFEDLPLGYYLIDSTMGALCGLTTTNPDASINAKNGQPTIDKQVQEDSTNQWGSANTADIGQLVYYRVTINVHAGAQNYVLHDVMSDGLTFDRVTSITHVVPGTDTGTVVSDTLYSVVVEDPETEEKEITDGCTFEVRFSKDFCDSLETNDKVIVYYQAMLNRNAIIATEENTNNAKLEFGEEHYTTEDSVYTKTYGIDIVKTDSQNTLIDGASFRIYDAATGGNQVAVVLMDDGVTYRRAREDETGVDIVVKNGKVRVVGFDNGTYYLEEVAAPAGYNKLTARQKFIIADANLDATFNDGIFSTGSGVHVVNKTGSMFPETGGIGRTIFYVGGGLLVAGAVVLLITKKRMGVDG